MTEQLHFDWRQARQQVVRELGWCLFSPPIVSAMPDIASSWPIEEDRGAQEILAVLDRSPEPLQQHFAALIDKRLGARFEAAWSFFFTHHPRYELLAQNWPVHHRGRTLGALDFLFVDHHTGTVIHAEMAVKFYLYTSAPPGAELSRWIGPNPDDTLHAKLHHLANHQLALSRHDETRLQLTRASLPVPDRTAVLVKGYLFHPVGEDIPVPPPVNPGHLRGEWLHQRDLPALLNRQAHAHKNSKWRLMPHHEWLMPKPGNDDTASLRHQASARLAETGQPAMICRFADEEPRVAAERFFVVPDQWPFASRPQRP